MPKHASRKATKQRPKPVSSRLYLRLAGFLAIVMVVLAVVLVLLRPSQTAVSPGEVPIRVDMAGFEPNVLQAKVGVPVKLRLINPDSQYHTDGGGKHQFAIPELAVDVVVPPESDRVVSFTPMAPGSYTFYCDVCCGGKQNPTMQGTLKVTT